MEWVSKFIFIFTGTAYLSNGFYGSHSLNKRTLCFIRNLKVWYTWYPLSYRIAWKFLAKTYQISSSFEINFVKSVFVLCFSAGALLKIPQQLLWNFNFEFECFEKRQKNRKNKKNCYRVMLTSFFLI